MERYNFSVQLIIIKIQLSIEDFLYYFDILIYGDSSEKAELTFKMIDINKNGYFDCSEFSKLIFSILQCWNNITGSQLSIVSLTININYFRYHEQSKINKFYRECIRKI